MHRSSFPKNLFPTTTKKSPPGAAPRQQQRVPLVNCCIFLNKKKTDEVAVDCRRRYRSLSKRHSPATRKGWRARKRAAQTMSRGPKRPHRQNPNVSRPKKSRDDEGSMSRTQKKDRGSANNVTQPQKAAKKPVHRSTWDRLSKKILFLTKRKVPTRGTTATAHSAG